jgi:hypothetical protein
LCQTLEQLTINNEQCRCNLSDRDISILILITLLIAKTEKSVQFVVNAFGGVYSAAGFFADVFLLGVFLVAILFSPLI